MKIDMLSNANQKKTKMATPIAKQSTLQSEENYQG